ncbi:MAG: hypothetical protein OXB84_06840 [Halobacteriovoraceae bacterium]|nr:hypothetical protein [Halobacteriovoraceae bacterium]
MKKTHKKISLKSSKGRSKPIVLAAMAVLCGLIVINETNHRPESIDLSKHWEKYLKQELYDFSKKMDQFTQNVSVRCDHFVANFSCTIYYDHDYKSKTAIDKEIKKMTNIFEKKFQALLLEIEKKSENNISPNNLVLYSMPVHDRIKKLKMATPLVGKLKENFENTKNF